MKSRKNLDYVLQEGEGTPVVFIHGWLGSKQFWKHIQPYLDIENPLLFYDQRCHGESRCSGFNMQTLVEDLRKLLEELEIEKPILVGHSMGGMVALKYASEGPVAGLALLATSASTPEPENRSVEYFLESFGKIDRNEWAEKIADNYVGDEEGEIRDLTIKELMEAGEESVTFGLKAMIDYDVRGQVSDIDVPAVVMSGARDRAITPRMTQELVDLLDCRKEVVDTTHQMLPEEPEKVAGIIQGFVEDLNSSRSSL